MPSPIPYTNKRNGLPLSCFEPNQIKEFTATKATQEQELQDSKVLVI